MTQKMVSFLGVCAAMLVIGLAPTSLMAETPGTYQLYRIIPCPGGGETYVVEDWAAFILQKVTGVPCGETEVKTWYPCGRPTPTSDPTQGMTPTVSGVDTLNRPYHAVVLYNAGVPTWAGGMYPGGTFWESDFTTSSNCGGSFTAPQSEEEELSEVIDRPYMPKHGFISSILAYKA